MPEAEDSVWLVETEDEDVDADEPKEEEEREDIIEEPEQVEPEIDYSLDPVAPEILFPAPPDAVAASWFVDRDSNIACELASRKATCTIYEYDFTADGPGCSSGPATIVLDEGGVRWDCTLPPVSRTDNNQAPILTPSTSAATGTGACLSTLGGMSCWNTLNGESFAISAWGWDEGVDGLIPENTFPWIGQVDRR